MKKFDPELYTIQIKKSHIDGECFYVAKVLELPDVTEYGDSYEEAYTLAIDTIETSYQMFQEQGMQFPEPLKPASENQLSGRLTVRMPKSLHASLIRFSEQEDASLNQIVTIALSSYITQQSTYQNLFTDAIRNIEESLERDKFQRIKHLEPKKILQHAYKIFEVNWKDSSKTQSFDRDLREFTLKTTNYLNQNILQFEEDLSQIPEYEEKFRKSSKGHLHA